MIIKGDRMRSKQRTCGCDWHSGSGDREEGARLYFPQQQLKVCWRREKEIRERLSGEMDEVSALRYDSIHYVNKRVSYGPILNLKLIPAELLGE